MMEFPPSFWDISLWLAVTAIVLLVTAELLSPYYGRANVTVDTRRLRNIALTVSILFLATVVIHVYQILAVP